jgi:HD-GYP domain-containing protein (c-di-GMP phosphodiesterase class II)
MLTKTVKSDVQDSPFATHAKALAVILREEFGVPFVFYNLTDGAVVWGLEGGRSHAGTALTLEAPRLAALRTQGRVSITPLPDGRNQLALPCYCAGKPVLVALGALTSLAGTRAQAVEEQARLQKWAQCVADRLQQADQPLGRRTEADAQPGPAVAWEALLTLDHLMRRLRTHKEVGKNQQRILQAARKLSGVGTLVWLAPEPNGPFLIEGEPCLSPWDARQLGLQLARLAETQGPGPLFCNNLQKSGWGTRFAQVANVLAFPIGDRTPLGWVLALNKGRGQQTAGQAGKPGRPGEPPPFRRSDAALLTPFTTLLDLHYRGSERYRGLKDLLVGLTRALTAAIDAKDAYTFGHSERVARIAVELGRELNLPEEELSDLYLTGLLHDIGKIGIRDSVLGKPGPLTPEESEHLKEHVTIGYKILADVQAIHRLLPGVLHHHERWDGAGYPEGLAGEAIALYPRILAVADSYDAMSTDRPYRKALPPERIAALLQEGAGSQWDPRLIQALQRCCPRVQAIRQRGIGESLRCALDGALALDRSSRMLSQSLPQRLPAAERS